MSLKGKAYIAGIFEHPVRKAPDLSTPQIHMESAIGALADAGLTLQDVDAYYCALSVSYHALPLHIYIMSDIV